MQTRHRIIVFHEDDAVRDAVATAAERWRVQRARSLGELEGVVQERAAEIVVTDGRAHDASLLAVLALLSSRCSVPRVLLIPSRRAEPFALAEVFSASEDPVHFLAADATRLPSRGVAVRKDLRESLYRLRLAPYAATLPALCVAHLGLAGMPFATLPSWLVKKPWRFRRMRDLTSTLSAQAETLLTCSRQLGVERTKRLVFRIRAHMAALLVVIGGYSWPEARETFGELDGSNFRRRVNEWLHVQVADLEAEVRRALAPKRHLLSVLEQAPGQHSGRFYRPDLRTYRVGS